MASAHRIERCNELEDCYHYRGVLIRRNDRERGCWGHWSVVRGLGHSHGRIKAALRRDLLAQIDRIIDGQAPN